MAKMISIEHVQIPIAMPRVLISGPDAHDKAAAVAGGQSLVRRAKLIKTRLVPNRTDNSAARKSPPGKPMIHRHKK
jgi:hypothetical protein